MILAASSILRLQLKRIHVEQQLGVFIADNEASEFLARDAADAAA